MVKISEISYGNFGRCVKLSNPAAELIVTVDVGPRIISYRLIGCDNVLFEDAAREFYDGGEELRGYFGEDKTWYIYGGHRLWSSPESYPHSYVPDNAPVAYTAQEREDGSAALCLTPPETRTGQQHTITVEMDADTPRVKLTHTLKNVSGATVTIAPWALTVCAAGSREIVPLSQRKSGLLSNRRCVFWEYSDLHDERFYMGNRYVTLRQVKGAPNKFKIGVNNEDGWAAVVSGGQIFLKNFDMNINGDYPDYGCSFETFTNGIFLECESLGEIRAMKHGEESTLVEYWTLERADGDFDMTDEQSIAAFAEKHRLCRR